MNIIDSFFIALGVKADTSGFREVVRQTEGVKASLLSVRTAVQAFMGSFAVAGIAKIGSDFEQNTIQIAGFLSALGLSSDFNAGLQDAARIIQKITTDAARLPGEAEEYVQVFKANAAYLKNGLPGANADQIAAFTNKLTAVAKTVASNLDAGTIARESSQLLAVQGRAGGHNVLWQKLMPFLMQVKGQANITAQSFNAMTQPKRVELLTAAFAKLQPMLDASADSFDAMFGAAKSSFIQLTRTMTAGIFTKMKAALASVNAAFYNADGTMTDFARDLVHDVSTVLKWLLQMGSAVAAAVAWLFKFKAVAVVLKLALVALAPYLAGMAFMRAAAGVARLVTGLSKLRLAVLANKLLIGGLVIAIALLAEDLYQFYNGGESVTGMLVKKWKPAIYFVIAALGLLTTALLGTQAVALASALKMGIAWGIANLPLLLTVGALALIAFAAYELWKHWDEVVKGMTEGWLGFVQTLKNAPHDIKVALGFGSDADTAKAKRSAYAAASRAADAVTPVGGDVVWTNPDTGLTETHRAGWVPPGAAKPGAMNGSSAVQPPPGGGAGGTSKTTNVHIANVNIKSTDPKGAARELQREVTRNGQGGTAY